MVSAVAERGRQFSYQEFLRCPSSLHYRSLPFLPVAENPEAPLPTANLPPRPDGNLSARFHGLPSCLRFCLENEQFALGLLAPR